MEVISMLFGWTGAMTSCICLVPSLLTYRPTDRRPERSTTRRADGPLDQPPDRLAYQSNAPPATARYGTVKEKWRSARMGIRGVFAVIRGGYSRGIRGYSRAFAPLMLVCDAKDLDVEIGISPQFHDSFPRRDPPPDHPPKTRNPCRADPLYNTNNEI